ncbi:MAG: lldP [Verrucomicrobiales bacterium]|nr:lldP [Verrucomicrobiales bacterium]MDB6130898.1 lldP [Verrucomicrobiales bacterium]
MWFQNYNPLGNAFLSTLVAALPILLLLSGISFLKLRIHFAAILGFIASFVIALFVYRMPAPMAGATALYGAAYGLFPIGWIVLNLMFFYQITVESGLFEQLKQSLRTIAPDPRVQLVLIPFCMGAFFEGVAGFGTPVAITGAILIQLGFKPLQASALSLIANTAPVAFGSLGTPIIALQAVTGMDLLKISAMVGRQLPFFSLIIPFWVLIPFCGFRKAWEVWPVALVAGVTFAIPQFLVSNYHGPWLVDIVGSLTSLACTLGFLKIWKPATPMMLEPVAIQGIKEPGQGSNPGFTRYFKGGLAGWFPWVVLSLIIFAWGFPTLKKALDKKLYIEIKVPYLDKKVVRVAPVAPPLAPGASPTGESALFKLNWGSATGTGILVGAVIAGMLIGFRPVRLLRLYCETIYLIRFSLLTILAMLALGYISKYSGEDATLGLALARSGALYPFFGTLLGWLGVALTGSDTASNVLFGSLQKITAEQVGVSPILMGAANSSGGVMGKMVDAQSIVVASTATNWYGHEAEILKFVFFHSLALASLVGLLVYAQAYIRPFSLLVVK